MATKRKTQYLNLIGILLLITAVLSSIFTLSIGYSELAVGVFYILYIPSYICIIVAQPKSSPAPIRNNPSLKSSDYEKGYYNGLHAQNPSLPFEHEENENYKKGYSDAIEGKPKNIKLIQP